MIKGMRWQRGMKIEEIRASGFNCLEYQYGDMISDFAGAGTDIAMGLIVGAEDICNGGLAEILEKAAGGGVSYLVVETVGMKDGEELCRRLENASDAARRSGIRIYIENGLINDGYHIFGNVFSEADFLIRLTDRLNLCGTESGRLDVSGNSSKVFGVCVNTGHANLLGRNICGMIEALGDRVCLVHVNDNDGSCDQRQIPFISTGGRGQPATDWYSIIGTLVRIRYMGPIVFDATGLFRVSPEQLYPAWYRLLAAVAGEWEKFFCLEADLRSRDCRILFGVGKMFENYMQVWGKAYPPAFAVDNNEELWGKEKMGVRICPPGAILEYPEKDRLVLVCNRYYDSIEKQLASMRVQSRRYDDKYFFRY